MNEKPRQVLCDLFTKRGNSLYEESGLCSALLKDYCNAYKSEIAIILVAIDENIPATLKQQGTSGSQELLIERLIKRLQDHRHLTAEAARWSVESWALALGVLVKSKAYQNIKPESSHLNVKSDQIKSDLNNYIYCTKCGKKNIKSNLNCDQCNSILKEKDVENKPVQESAFQQLQYAGFWIRFGAFIIDTVLIFAFIFIIFLIWFGLNGSSIDDTMSNLIGLVVDIVWFPFAESSSWQASIGKKIVGLKVIDKQGNKISFGRAFIRYISMFLSVLTLGFGFLAIFFTKYKQGLHDKISGTFIIRS